MAARAACGDGVALLGATAGSTLRCAVPGAVARVSAGGACRGRTGATCGPRARWTDGPCQEPAVPPGSPSPWPLATTAAGTVLGSPGPAVPDPRVNDRVSLMSPVGASSRTACESVPEKEGFCHAVSEPPNSADATV
ncbi:hypothetical protein ACWCQM_01050 [Streptomyces sp. NPDC002125]